MNKAPSKCSGSRKKGSVLVAVLWCLSILFVVVVGILHTSRLDLVVAKRYTDRIRAHYLAVAGIERAKALVYEDARNRTRNRKNHTGEMYNAPANFKETAWGPGHFTIARRGSAEEGGGVIYGVTDEESRLNVNYASVTDLANLYGMTPDIAAAIVDWRDGDNEALPGGAELDYYSSLAPPRRPRNGLFETVRELLMVRGMTREQLLGSDRDFNGQIPEPDEAEAVNPPAEPGWAELLTVHSQNDNVNAAGTDRIDIQNADERTLAGLPGLNQDIARAIVSYRARRALENITDLLDVVAAQPQSQDAGGGPQPAGGSPIGPGAAQRVSPGQQPGQPTPPEPSGPKVISTSMFMEIADDVTTKSDQTLPGLMNVNTASLDALICLPGISRELASRIIATRQSDGFFQSIAGLLKVSGVTSDLLKRLEPRITTRSETYRIFSEGIVKSTGARQRIEETVHIGLNDVTTLAYRERDL